MQLELLGNRWAKPPAGEAGYEVAAAVVRAAANGRIVFDLGPADGPPSARLVLSAEEARRLIATTQAVVDGSDEEILLVEE